LVMLMTNNSSIQEVLFFPQMRPENIKKEEISTPAEFEAIGVPANWVPIIIEMGLKTIALLKEAKATQIHQTLNGLRKKKKLDMPALQLDEILTWQQA
jgi:lysyl-tRNA synthetase class 2